jgi:hypothetical protein
MMNRLSLSLYIVLMLFLAGCDGEQPAESPVAQVADTAVPPICRVLQELNFRAGPGLSYEPPIRAFPADTLLTPIAFSPIGFPGGQWVQARDAASGEIGWVSAGSQFVDCNLDLTTLPLADEIPPVPTLPPPPTLPPVPTTNAPTPTANVPTPTIAVDGPPRVTNNVPGGTAADYVEGEVIVNDAFLFRMRVADTRFGHEDGAGIDHVEFTITTLAGDTIYFNREDFAAYCIFQGGEPDCNLWTVRNGRYFWGQNGPEMQSGEYHARILVYPQAPAFDDEVWNWDFDFTLDSP